MIMPKDHALDVKFLIQDTEGIPIDQQRLVFGGTFPMSFRFQAANEFFRLIYFTSHRSAARQRPKP